MVIRQDLWQESPCSACFNTPCCRNLPLAPLKLDRQSDFVNLILSSCYEGIFPALRKSGDWTVYLSRDCSFLDKSLGKCSIHKSPGQSLICKSYDAHKCWYVDAFNHEKYTTMIPFNTSMMIWLEKKFNFIQHGFDIRMDWNELCESSFNYKSIVSGQNASDVFPWISRTLSFKKSREEKFIFLPPYKRPEHKNHFELLSFRLSFPGVYLAVADNCWAYMVISSLNEFKLDMIRSEYYPMLRHKDGEFSFDSIKRNLRPFSETGEQWVILQRSNIELLKSMTVFDSSGNIKRLPSSSEILEMLKFINPDLAA